VFLDITATPEARNILAGLVQKVSEVVFMPLSVGGGLRTLEDMRSILIAGADKVSINTAAVINPPLIAKAAEKFGSQCIVVAIDAKRTLKNGRTFWEVYINSGQKPTGINALAWAEAAVEHGAGELLLTSIDADGHNAGYDIELTRAVSESVPVPVIASGGAGTLEDLNQALTAGKADAVLAASIFHYGTYTIGDVKKYLAEKGIPGRL